MSDTAADTSSPIGRYSLAASRAASVVIDSYSTSFGAATKLLGVRHREHVRNIYALVRVADELVDGVAEDYGLDCPAQHALLDELEAETVRAIATGYSSNLVVHAFAQTARAARIDSALTAPFFASMRADLPVLADGNQEDSNSNSNSNSNQDAVAEASADTAAVTDIASVTASVTNTDTDTAALRLFDAEQHRAYVYGSAEVVGLMCLRVFVRDSPLTTAEHATLVHGAKRLGAAFQNVNFLRDLADDTGRLGRSYLSADERLTDADRDRWVTQINDEIADARAALALLPTDARTAVRCALNLFAALNTRIARTPAVELYRRRVRVPGPQKALILGRSVLLPGTRS